MKLLTEKEKQEIKEKYSQALEKFSNKLKEDPTILGLILGGSLNNDEPWTLSDIDVCIIHDDERTPFRFLFLYEDDVTFETHLESRNTIKRAVGSQLTGSMNHSTLLHSKLLWAKDKSIEDIYENVSKIGESDKQKQLLALFGSASYYLRHAKKNLYFLGDPVLSYYYLLPGIAELAKIESFMADEAPLREVLRQGLKFNASFFNNMYLELAHKKKTFDIMDEALKKFEKYLDNRLETIHKPLFDYLVQEKGRPVSQTEIDDFFRVNRGNYSPWHNSYDFTYLMEKGYIDQHTKSRKLTNNSRVLVDEPAYTLVDKNERDQQRLSQYRLYNESYAELKGRYEEAVIRITQKLQQDDQILAVVLQGSVAEDEVWNNSDINLLIIHKEEKKTPKESITLVENGIITNAYIISKESFRTDLEIGPFKYYLLHQSLTTGRILFSNDEFLTESIEDIMKPMKNRDSKILLMGNYAGLMYYYEKASKMLYSKNEPEYSFYYILIHLIWNLATVTLGLEAIKGNYYPLRKIVRRCLKIEPELYKPLFTDLINANKDFEYLSNTLQIIKDYLDEVIETVYDPIFKFIKRAGHPVTEDELTDYLGQKGTWSFIEPLVREGLLERTLAPARLTTRSRVHMNQAAYHLPEDTIF